MAATTAIYEGVEYTLDADVDPPKLVIGGQDIHVERDRYGKFWTPKDPHRKYGSLSELAAALVVIQRKRGL